MEPALPTLPVPGGRLPRGSRLLPNPQLRLADQCREVLRFKHYSYRTEQTYLDWIERYVRFCRELPEPAPAQGGEHPALKKLSCAEASPAALSHPMRRGGPGAERGKQWRHPRECGAAELTAFLSHLAQVRKVGASTQNQALNALVFLYEQVLGIELGEFSDFARAKRPVRLPAVLTREECSRLFARMEPPLRWIAQLLYGSGLRLSEGLRLRVKDVDLARGLITVRNGKGDKDRVTMVPASLGAALKEQLAHARRVWAGDRSTHLAGVWLPEAVAVKYPKAGEEWSWFWLSARTEVLPHGHRALPVGSGGNLFVAEGV